MNVLDEGSMQPSDAAGQIENIPAFSPNLLDGANYIPDLPEGELISSGTSLVKQNEHPTVVHLVRSGIFKLSYLNEHGQEFLLGLRSEGWWMNSMQVLLNVPSLVSVEAKTSCVVSSFSADDFSQRISKNPRMMRHFLSSLCREVVVQTQLQIMLLSASAETRLRHMLDEHEHSVWKTLDPTAIMCQGEIAKLLAITPEHLSRILHRQQFSR
jgi:CRP-like cAMP-binding protein